MFPLLNILSCVRGVLDGRSCFPSRKPCSSRLARRWGLGGHHAHSVHGLLSWPCSITRTAAYSA